MTSILDTIGTLSHEVEGDILRESPNRVLQLDADAACYKVCHPEYSLERNKRELIAYIESIRKLSGSTYVCAYLTTHLKGGRTEMAYYGAYQSKRAQHKQQDPAYSERIRELRNFLSTYSSQTVLAVPNAYLEADEVIGAAHRVVIQTTGDYFSSVIATSDKDLNKYYGTIMSLQDHTFTHLDPNKPFGWIDFKQHGSTKKLVGRGTKFFWAQMLSGDTVDTVTGLPFLTHQMLDKHFPVKKKTAAIRDKQPCGDGKAVSILASANSDAACFRLVSECYRSYFGADWQFFFFEMAFILWMRDTNDILDVMHFLQPLGFDYVLHPQQQEALHIFHQNCLKVGQ